MVQNKVQNQVVELLGVQAEAEAENQARAAAGARASVEVSLQNLLTKLGVEARLQGLDAMMGVERREFFAALEAQARGGDEAQSAAEERLHTAEAALEAARQDFSSAVLAQAEAEAVSQARAEAAAHASEETRLQILLAKLPSWRPSGVRPLRRSSPALEPMLRRRLLHQGRLLQAARQGAASAAHGEAAILCQGKTEAALRAVVQESAVVPFMQWRPLWRPLARRLGSCLRRCGMAGGV